LAKGGLKLPAAKERSCVPLDPGGLPRPPAPGKAHTPTCGALVRYTPPVVVFAQLDDLE